MAYHEMGFVILGPDHNLGMCQRLATRIHSGPCVTLHTPFPLFRVHGQWVIEYSGWYVKFIKDDFPSWSVCTYHD